MRAEGLRAATPRLHRRFAAAAGHPPPIPPMCAQCRPGDLLLQRRESVDRGEAGDVADENGEALKPRLPEVQELGRVRAGARHETAVRADPEQGNDIQGA